MLKFAEVLQTWWPRYVEAARGPIPARHWHAVEAVLSCRTPRRGGKVAYCSKCEQSHFFYHACNHRACPACGARDQQQWAHRQEARILPVPYYLVTFTVPESLRSLFQHYPTELYPLFFQATSKVVKDLCANPKFLGGDPGFISVLHSWTRRMLLHPHIHMLIPAVGWSDDALQPVHPPELEFFLPVKALSARVSHCMHRLLKSQLPALFAQVPADCWRAEWVSDVRHVGSGRKAVRYLAAYVKKSAFTEQRLLGYDEQGRIRLAYQDRETGCHRVEALEPLELIRRWLLHVLPKGLMRVRHYGWLSAASHRTFGRIRFFLGLKPWRAPESLPEQPLCCAHCGHELTLFANLQPMRGPPLARTILR